MEKWFCDSWSSFLYWYTFSLAAAADDAAADGEVAPIPTPPRVDSGPVSISFRTDPTVTTLLTDKPSRGHATLPLPFLPARAPQATLPVFVLSFFVEIYYLYFAVRFFPENLADDEGTKYEIRKNIPKKKKKTVYR